MLKIALLDDYVGLALEAADWSPLQGRAEITVFDHHLDAAEAADALQPFDVICTIRERMSLPASLLEHLPNLKLITIIGDSLPNLDMAAASEHGVTVCGSRTSEAERARTFNATPELTWGLMLATVRHIGEEHHHMRSGGWQSTVGLILHGRTLGLLGLGRIGKRMAQYAQAFGMDVIAWSQNLKAEDAEAVGVRRVEKDELFQQADVISIHLKLSDRSRGLVAAREFGLMKPEAYLINTSRGPIVAEADLIAALRENRIAGAGLDVFGHEPLPDDHPLRTLPNATLTPHLGYFTRETMRAFYGDTAEAVIAFADGKPIRVLNAPLGGAAM